MSDFSPIDHKESDQEYAARVRGFVAKRVGTELLPIEDASFWIGRWRSSLKKKRQTEYDIEYLSDSTFRRSAAADSKPGRWQPKDDVYIQTTWVPPMPEYGIETETWNQEAYRCARTEDGRIVYWNGDSSLVVVLTSVGKSGWLR